MEKKGCGKFTRVIGTNGGGMPCGATLHDLGGKVAPYYCAECEPAPAPEAAPEGGDTDA